MIEAIVSIVFGVAMFLRGDVVARWVVRRRQRRLNQLNAGEPERYFEELRSLENYPAFTKPWVWRLIGSALIVQAITALLLR